MRPITYATVYLVLSLMFFFTGCVRDQLEVTERPSTAKLISTTLKPRRSGLIELENNTKSARDAATRIMKKVCAPQLPELVQVEKVTKVTGAAVATKRPQSTS